jgi:pimeloyl-ACP methyl ester carboxylesterase
MQQRAISDHGRRICCRFGLVGMSGASGLHDVVERSGNVGGIETHWREAPSAGCPPVLYVHGVPTASWDWLPYLQRIGGIAPDLPGFGESAKPSDFDYSITGYERWLETFTRAVGLERFSLVVHDWGGLALALAQRFPERIDRLVLHSCVTLLPGYRWHWIARVWRTPILGEVFMACSTKWGFRQISRQSNVTPGPLPDAMINRFWPDFDRQTRRAILRLYRSADPDVLARAGERLKDLQSPALILWPTNDPYVGPEWGQRYADALGGQVRLEVIDRAGHWMWLDRPDVIEMAAQFLQTPV